MSIGDLVLINDGSYAPIKWLGHKTIRVEDCKDPLLDYPVKISKDALGMGLPNRVLTVSPDHSLFIDDCLINVGVLADLSADIV